MESRQYEGKSAPFDNSREALAYIGAVYGAQALLSDQVKTLLAEIAPHLPPLGRNVVHNVIHAGALVILKAALVGSEEAQEKAFDRAVQSVVENFGMNRTLAEDILSEFVDALGWEISAATPVTEVEQKPRKPEQNKINNEKHEKTQVSLPQQAETVAIPHGMSLEKQEEARLSQQPETSGGALGAVNGALLDQQAETKTRSAYADLKAGQRNVSFGKYKWRVLDVKDGKALLLSEDILEKRAYHHNKVYITWEKCDLRGYLNEEFLRKFKEEEQKQVATVTNINEDNQWYNTAGGSDTKDKIFLLSPSEVVKYFGDSGNFDNPSMFRKYRGFYKDQYSDARVAKYGNIRFWWRLRSPGRYSRPAAYVYDDGDLIMGGNYFHSDKGGVRPALWLNL